MTRDWEVRADELAWESITGGDPTAWFDQLYAEGVAGRARMPWDRTDPHPLVSEWASSRGLASDGHRAVVVGAGLGADAEYLAGLGYDVTGFDISPVAVAEARRRNPDSRVDYLVADLLALPDRLVGAFDLVVEVFTLQALPDPPRSAAARAVAGLVRGGGTMLAVAFRTDGDAPSTTGPPYALDRATMEGIAVDGLELVRLEALDGPRWRSEYQRV